MRPCRLYPLLLAVGTFSLVGALRPAGPPVPGERHRSPTDLALLPDGRHALTANSTADSVSIIDLEGGKLLGEVPAGKRPSAVACSRDGKRAAVSNLWDGTVSLYALAGHALEPAGSVAVGPLPRGLVFASDGTLFVAISGADEVAAVDIGARKVMRRLAAPREPYCLALSPDGSLLACASSRSGEVRLWEVKGGKRLWERKIEDGFNLRGLSFSPDGSTVLVAHAVRRSFPVTRENIDRGWVIDNRLTRFPVKADVVPELEQVALDPRGKAVADPSGVLLSPDGQTLAVSAAGTKEVLLFPNKAVSWSAGDPGDLINPDLLEEGRLRRVPTGEGPRAILFRPGGKELAVACYFAAAVMVLDVPTGKVKHTIPLGGPAEPSVARQGEALFHDGRRSHNQWFSCSTCHPDGHTSAQAFDTLNDAAFGDPKLTPSLRGVARTAPYTWHGWQKNLDDAVVKSFVDTMHGTRPTPEETRAVVAFLSSLEHPPSPARLPAGKLSAEAKRGAAIFDGKARCARCHQAPEWTTPRTYDVKLGHDGSPYDGWNPPSLRGLWDRGPFLHDGRARTLQEVLTRWHSPELLGGARLTPAEQADLLAFLRSL